MRGEFCGKFVAALVLLGDLREQIADGVGKYRFIRAGIEPWLPDE